MAIYFGELGQCTWTCIIGPFTDADVDAFVAQLDKVARTAHSGHVVLDLFHDIPMPNASQRKRVAEKVSAITRTFRVAGHAVVSNSQTMRGVMTAVNWLVRPAFPERMFAEPEAGVQWLHTCNPKVDPTELLRSVSEQVEGFRHLKW